MVGIRVPTPPSIESGYQLYIYKSKDKELYTQIKRYFACDSIIPSRQDLDIDATYPCPHEKKIAIPLDTAAPETRHTLVTKDP